MARSSDGCVLVNAIENVLEDPSFATGSSVAEEALQAARKLLQWCQDPGNLAVVTAFPTKLVSDLQEAFKSSCGRRPLNMEILWKSFFSIRSSTGFISHWSSFLESARVLATPILYQQLTDLIFRKLACEHYKVPSQPTCSSSSHEIGSNEVNALRYAAGYVVNQISAELRR